MSCVLSNRDRRVRRSQAPGEATTLFLSSFARRHGLSAVALASDEGLLVAGAGEGVDLEALAAATVCPEDVVGSETVCSLPVRVGDETLTLAMLGGMAGADEVQAAMARIHAW